MTLDILLLSTCNGSRKTSCITDFTDKYLGQALPRVTSPVFTECTSSGKTVLLLSIIIFNI